MEIDLTRLGNSQKHILRKMAFEKYHISEMQDTHNLTKSIMLVNDSGDIDQSISQAQLQSLVSRKLFIKTDVSLSERIIQSTYFLSDPNQSTIQGYLF